MKCASYLLEKSIDYTVLKRKLLPNAPLEYWDDRCFDENFSDREIKNAIGWRASKNIIAGGSCFKCQFNLRPGNSRCTECGLPGQLSLNHCLEPIGIMDPKKAVCDFFQTPMGGKQR